MSHNANSNCSRAWILLWENLILKVCHSELTGDGHWENLFIFLISSSQSRPLELRIWTFVQVRHFVSWRFHILVLIWRDCSHRCQQSIEIQSFYPILNCTRFRAGIFILSLLQWIINSLPKCEREACSWPDFTLFKCLWSPLIKHPPLHIRTSARVSHSSGFLLFSRLIERKSGVRPDFFDCSTESSFILSGQRSQVHLCTWKKYEFVLAIALVKLFQEQIKMDIFLIETWNKEHGHGCGKAGKWNKENKVMQSVVNSN